MKTFKKYLQEMTIATMESPFGGDLKLYKNPSPEEMEEAVRNSSEPTLSFLADVTKRILWISQGNIPLGWWKDHEKEFSKVITNRKPQHIRGKLLFKNGKYNIIENSGLDGFTFKHLGFLTNYNITQASIKRSLKHSEG